ncbi:HtaA domain-containing protein [Nocardioides sp. W7]|uniref:HtaA domain-containing protein n=1 Tax=Nocardioides sp. W7 TaxID=2931390 RepID=UPI001FD564C5|nr:HtaA domain-containing protein [Nocardioides sp. W7]
MQRPDRGARTGAAAALLVAGLVSLIVGVFATLPAGAAGEGPDDEITTTATSPATATATPTVEPTDPSDPSDTASPTTSPSPSETPSESPTETSGPTTGPTPSPTATGGPVEVAGAVLRWGVSDQTNARSHNPAAINFLAAGVADPGRGGVALRESQWRAVQGNVTIEKATPAGGWSTATWAGLGTSPAGAPIGVYGPFSEHAVVLRKGTGTVDRAAGTATVSWQGTFTVVYYGGNTIFTVTDPTLEVAGGSGSLTATLGGFLADRDDPTIWTAAVPKRVRLADLPTVDLGALGLTAQPAYDDVAVTGSEPQDRTGSGWGAFPQAFVSYLQPFGVDQFWYSTGLQSDSTKRPLPLTISYSAKEIAAPAPTKAPSATPDVDNSAPAAPTPVAAPVPPVTAPLAVAGVPAGTTPLALAAPAPLPATVQLASAPVAGSTPAASAAAASAGWFVGGALLLAAAFLLLLPAPGSGPRRTPS